MASQSESRARTAAYILEARRARGFPASRPTAEEVREQREQRDLFRFAEAFSRWITGRSALLRQHRAAFERERTSPWRPDAFTEWLPADAKEEVCAELARMRAVFAEELKGASDIDVAPHTMASIVRCVEDFVRRARSRRHPKDYAARHSKAREDAKWRVERVQGRLRDLVVALQRLRTQDVDALLAHELFDLRWILAESILGRALQGPDPESADIAEPLLVHDLCGDDALTEKFVFALDDLARRLDAWTPSSQRPISRSLLESLLRIYERTSGRRAAADWAHGSAKAVGPFSRFLAAIYAAVPQDVQRFAAASPAAFIDQAKRLIRARNGGD